MHIQLPENLRSIQQMGVVNDLVNVVSEERQVEDERDPVAVDQEQEGEETVDGCFRDDVGVQAVAEVDWVDVVAAGCQFYLPLWFC